MSKFKTLLTIFLFMTLYVQIVGITNKVNCEYSRYHWNAAAKCNLKNTINVWPVSAYTYGHSFDFE